MPKPNRPPRLPRAAGEQRRSARRDARTLADAYSLSDAAREVLELGLAGGTPSCSEAVKRELTDARLAERHAAVRPILRADLAAAGASAELLEQLPVLMPGGYSATLLCRERLRNLARAVRAVEAAGEGAGR